MKIKKKNITYFLRQLSILLEAKIPLAESLQIVKNATDCLSMQSLIATLKTDLESGLSFSEALAKYPQYFDSIFLSLIRAGESCGNVAMMLSKIATFAEKRQKLQQKIQKAMIYPLVVITFGLIITILLMVYIVPQFEKLYANFSVSLPLYTRFVLNAASFFQKFGLTALLIMTSVFWIILKYQKQSVSLIKFKDKALLKAPLFGKILQKAILVRFCHTFATTFKAGVPLVNCLNLSADACASYGYTKAVLQMKQQVTKGSTLYNAMQNENIFPKLLLQMIAVGESSGSLEAILDKTAEFYEAEVEMAIDSLSQLLEPLMITFLGILIGGLVIAMYLPIFKMGTIL